MNKNKMIKKAINTQISILQDNINEELSFGEWAQDFKAIEKLEKEVEEYQKILNDL